MVKFNCIVREDNIGKTISVDGMVDAVDIEETLKTKYAYLYQSMLDTGYKVKVNHCTYFKEIVFKKKVVGFCAYTIINSVSKLSLVSTYILPEFRKRGLFFDEINHTYEEGNEISIFDPPSFVMKLLIKYGFAKDIGNNLIVSSIMLDVPSTSITDIYGSDSVEYSDFTYSTNIYDYNLCGSVIIVDEEKEIVYISKSSDKDNERYDCLEKRANIDDEYYVNIIKHVQNNKQIIDKFINNIEQSYASFNEDYSDKPDFEDFKKLNQEQSERELSDYFNKIDETKNSLYDPSSIDKEKYILAFQNVGIYDFIRTFEENNNIELTNSIIKIDYDFKPDYIKNLVLNEGYISNESSSEEVDEYLNSLKVNDLKNILKDNHLTVTGNKSELVDRIKEYVPSSSVLDKEYSISDKGLEFIESHEDIEFYNLFLKNFYYYEFKDFLNCHDGSITEVSKEFLKEHLYSSVKKKDNKAYTDSINALAFINELNNDLTEGLYFELKKFIIGLNPLFLDESSYNYYQPISKTNIDNINLLLFKGDFNLKEEFKKAWDSMEINNFMVSYSKSFKTLDEMLSGEDRDYMNDKIRELYLTKKTIHDKLDKSKQSTLDKYLTFN
ncbi:MAG: SAP domain-containing protein [Methanosphaera sp.]|nr:SAP domain-containing protein [Methanosphaera sp.]